MANTSNAVARILYKEIKLGDLKKIQARSNSAATGGGARDFRFGSYERLLPVIRFMFPDTAKLRRKRGNVYSEIDVFKGSFYWETADGEIHCKDSYLEPPTDARGTEGRISRVHEYPCFDRTLIPKKAGGAGNRVLLLLIQKEDNTVWPFYVEESTLRVAGKWNEIVANELLNCLDAKRSAQRSVIGYRDFLTKDKYCNGK